MRKRIISTITPLTLSAEPNWLIFNDLVEVELTSEDPLYPIENALAPGKNQGWRAEGNGQQIIRLIFAYPLPLSRILLKFLENQVERTQEFVLRWSADNGQSFQEINRQQWNFSPQDSTCETEYFQVELTDATILELTITPDISDNNAVASLFQWRLA